MIKCLHVLAIYEHSVYNVDNIRYTLKSPYRTPQFRALPSTGGTQILHYRCGKDQLVCQLYNMQCVYVLRVVESTYCCWIFSKIGYSKFIAAGLSSQSWARTLFTPIKNVYIY